MAFPSQNGDIEILTRGETLEKTGRRKRKGHQRTVTRRTERVSMDVRSEDTWVVSANAGDLVDVAADEILKVHQKAIIHGQKADGSGSQPPLTERVAKRKGRKSRHRGFNTGFFADTIRRTRITGRTDRAQTWVKPHPHRNVFIAQEAKRGHSYFFVTGNVDEAVTEALAKVLSKMVDKQR